MTWHKMFKSQCYDQPTYVHKKYPIYVTSEFDFYRCVEFKEEFYYRTASELFNENLRNCEGRYSKLFPNQRISYWADSPITARAEIKKHGSGCNILTFWAYDDSSSFIPCLGNSEKLYILDGRKCGIQNLIDKVDQGVVLEDEDNKLIQDILNEKIDCIAYDSKAHNGGENFIFLECGFKKLALRKLSLRFGRKDGGSHAFISIVTNGDYTPCLKYYGEYFVPKCRKGMDTAYLNSEEYKTRRKNMDLVYNAKFSKKM